MGELQVRAHPSARHEPQQVGTRLREADAIGDHEARAEAPSLGERGVERALSERDRPGLRIVGDHGITSDERGSRPGGATDPEPGLLLDGGRVLPEPWARDPRAETQQHDDEQDPGAHRQVRRRVVGLSETP